MKELRKEADCLWSNFKRGDMCEICGEENVSPHHIVHRRNKTLRWDLRNRIFLCNSCHIEFAHGSPTEFKRWFEENRKEDYKYLMDRKNLISKWTEEEMKKIIENLK